MFSIIKIIGSGTNKIFLWFEKINNNPNYFYLAKIVIFLAIFSYFCFFVLLTLDPDFGWHLQIGNLILRNHQIPRYDELSYSMAGHPWVDHEWLINILLAGAYNYHLNLLVIFIFVLMAALPFAYWVFALNLTLHSFRLLSVRLHYLDLLLSGRQ